MALRHGWLVLGLPVCMRCAAGNDRVGIQTLDSAGVTIVVNAGADRVLRWRFDEVYRLGGQDAGPESFYEVSPEMVAPAPGGGLVVLNRTAQRVEVFDEIGGHRATLGRPGGGPGELRNPSTVSVDAAGVVTVVDRSKRTLVRFDPAGAPLAEIPFGGPFVTLRQAHFTFDGTSAYFRILRPLPETGESSTALVRATGVDTSVVAVAVVSTALVDFGCVRVAGQEPLFTRHLIGGGHRRVRAVNTVADYVLDVFEDDRLVRSVRRAVPMRRTSPAVAERAFPDGIVVRNNPECRLPAALAAERMGMVEFVPAIRRVAVTPAGGVWVVRWTFEDEPTAVDVFAPSGEYVGTLEGPEGRTPIGFTTTGRLVAAETDAMDVSRAVIYEIVRLP